MSEELDWFPIDTRILPFDFSLQPPASRWVRGAVFLELLLAVITVVGTFLLVILPPNNLPLTSCY